MSILGIIAEYDPFHNGHLYHLNTSRERVQPDFTYVALSPCIKQRGSFSLLSPADRAKCAILCGADAVFSLPVLWTVRDAEHYALGALSLLYNLGITHLAFGAECNDLSLLQRIAELLESQKEPFQSRLHMYLEQGTGYPSAISASVTDLIPEAYGILHNPNNILAVCYLRTIRRLGVPITPILISRQGMYHEYSIVRDAPSASAIRNAVLRGDWASAGSAMPESVSAVIREAFLSSRHTEQRNIDRLMISVLRSLAKKSANHLPDASEGLGDRLISCAGTARSEKELLQSVSTKRYTASRVSRICAMAMLGISSDDLESLSLPSYAYLLAMRKNSAMTSTWKQRPIKVITSLTDAEDPLQKEADLRAYHLWAECASLPYNAGLADYLFSI